ncbi:MAG: glycosyltransferase, partial [Clostridiales bacterium]|nr:glycosyltransferase [Clostridiales bacterium]
MLISLVVPCYNEESSLPLLYEALTEVRKKLTECRFELIFVDDGSKDGTLPALKKICDGDSDARYLSFSRNFGKEAALFAGLSETRGDLVALLD